MKYIIAKKTDDTTLEYFAGITKGEAPELVWTFDKDRARRYADEDAVLHHLALIPGGMWGRVEE